MFGGGDLDWVDRFSVDLKDDSGRILRGLVRDMVPDKGLVLDFDYPGHNADLVPFGKCFQPDKYGDRVARHYNVEPGDVVEVLLQRSADEPWYWYSAKAFNVAPKRSSFHYLHPTGTSYDYGRVEVDLGGHVSKEVVLGIQLRSKKVQQESISPTHFDKHIAKLSVGEPFIYFFTTRMNGFLEEWKRGTGEIFVELKGRNLVYIDARDGKIRNDKSVTEFLFSRVVQTVLSKEADRRAKLANDDWDPHIHQSQPVDDKMVNFLPELLSEVFTYMNVVDQKIIVDVWRKWNTVFQATAASARVELDMNTTTYSFAVLLHKSVTKSTKGLLIVNSAPVASDPELLYRRLEPIVAVLEWNCIKLRRIIIRGTVINPKLSNIVLEGKRLPHLEHWRTVCEELVLEYVNVAEDGGSVTCVKRGVVAVDQPVVPEEFLQKCITKY